MVSTGSITNIKKSLTQSAKMSKYKLTKIELLSKKGKMKLGLQIILGILSLIPAIVSILGITQGVVRFIPDSVTANFDSHYRYLTGYYLSLSLLVWWIIPQIEKHKTVLRIVCGGIFFGGIGRIISMTQIGIPGFGGIAFTGLELMLPLLCIWQAKLPRAK